MKKRPSKKMEVACFDMEPETERSLTRHLPASRFTLRFFRRPLRPSDCKNLQNTEVLVVFIHSAVTKAIVEQMPKLRFVTTCSTGYDHIDVAACQNRNILVANVPTYGENTVAEHTFALLLSLTRNVHLAYEKTQHGDFAINQLRGLDIAGKTFGVVGCGKIGMHVIRIAKGFGMNVLAYDPRQNDRELKKAGAQAVTLDRLLRTSDVVSLHVPLLPSTKHMINARSIARMKQGSILLNTARGGLVDTHALLCALQNGKLAYAGLDVLEEEEAFLQEETQLLTKKFSQKVLQAVLEDHVLMNQPNALVTPHIAFDTHEAVERIYKTTADNVVAFAKKKPTNIVRFVPAKK